MPIASAFLVAACTAADHGAGLITPEQAVMAAANAAPHGISGTFALTVRGVGTQDGRFYLNSQPDYRDQRNLTIDIDPSVERTLESRLGASSLSYFAGKPILVTGVAQRVKVFFIADGDLRTNITTKRTFAFPILSRSGWRRANAAAARRSF